ncbi:hypothetical protein BCR43DRAFT_484232 [Syncephalastrum racemosum]|uniref:SWI/SNF and RSC complexes subunit Ssr4 C-terminal domain-containing protein n=1 Tax=Syncephalastrum racemosum TaxID=13706 RepID=A0A1X2HWR6_SYNRA|nr:hypothetical protein BCR43DRAFT_484232 [Syncephalastrum racemosum]
MSQPYYYNQPNPMASAGRGMNPAAPMMPQAYMQPSPYRNVQQPSAADAAYRKRQQPKQAQRPGGMQLMEETEEPSGDELDDISARDIAMARYKRNHDYLSEIFTPYNASSIIPPPFEAPQNKDDLKKMIEEQEALMQEREESSKARLAEFTEKRKEYWRLTEAMKEASSLDAIHTSARHYEQFMDAKLEHNMDTKRTVQIPGVEEDPEPAPPKQQQDVNVHPNNEQSGYQASPAEADPFGYTESKQDMPAGNEDTNSDHFFDEMVNTNDDEGGSVSEFLNTNDMDFEQTKPE